MQYLGPTQASTLIGDRIGAAHRGAPVPPARAGGTEADEEMVRGDEVDDPLRMSDTPRAAPHPSGQPLRHRFGGRACHRAEEPALMTREQGHHLLARLRSDPVRRRGG
eukprot:gene14158-biopygen4885